MAAPQLTERYARLACGLSANAFSIDEITAISQLTEEQILKAIASATDLSVKEVKVALNLQTLGKSLETISDLFEVGHDVLKKFMPHGELFDKKKDMISVLERKGSSTKEISYVLTLGEDFVKASLRRRI
jgi:hypothetical protein